MPTPLHAHECPFTDLLQLWLGNAQSQLSVGTNIWHRYNYREAVTENTGFMGYIINNIVWCTMEPLLTQLTSYIIIINNRFEGLDKWNTS